MADSKGRKQVPGNMRVNFMKVPYGISSEYHKLHFALGASLGNKVVYLIAKINFARIEK